MLVETHEVTWYNMLWQVTATMFLIRSEELEDTKRVPDTASDNNSSSCSDYSSGQMLHNPSESRFVKFMKPC